VHEREGWRVTRQGETERSSHQRETEQSAHEGRTGPSNQIPVAEPATQAPESEYARQFEDQRSRVPPGVPFDSSMPSSSAGSWQGRWREYSSSSSIPSQASPRAIERRVDWEAVQQTQAQDRHRRTPEVRWIRQAQQAAVSMERIEQRLLEWKNRCVVCSLTTMPRTTNGRSFVFCGGFG